MGYIRFLWTAIVLILVLVISIPAWLFLCIVGLFSMPLRDKMTMACMHFAFKIVLLAAGTRVHISGYDNIPKDKAVVFIGNHRSMFDILIAYSIFPKITSFIAKKEIKKVPILSWWMMLLHNLFLDRNDIKQGLKVILTAIEYVEKGINICIFPEGTRNKTEEDILKFHEGSFKVADKSGCPIIPMTMYNMSAIFEDHMPKITREDVYIDFGTPIYPNDLSKEERKHLGAYVHDIMVERYRELKEIAKN